MQQELSANLINMGKCSKQVEERWAGQDRLELLGRSCLSYMGMLSQVAAFLGFQSANVIHDR